jgi:chromosomal replication initiation ATPase DnaA
VVRVSSGPDRAVACLNPILIPVAFRRAFAKKGVQYRHKICENDGLANSKCQSNMTLYLKSGKCFKVTTKGALDIYERLPVATYTVKEGPPDQYTLDKIDSFTVDGKIYGDTQHNVDRILRTFMDRKSSTGVLLAGEKGSGKTLLTKLISLHASAQGIATIVINEPLGGESFNEFLQMIKQPTILLFDEFEKVYRDNDDQERMLTLLDGVYSSKKLFLFTCNEKDCINTNMMNRPGRIFYSLDFLWVG